MAAWKEIVFIAALMATVSGPALAGQHTPSLPLPDRSENGMYAQKWLYKSSLNLREDLAAASKAGKRLVIFWEEKQCTYCKPMYEINLSIPRIVGNIKKKFNVIKLDIWGDRKVTDLDGTVLTEKELASKYRIRYTPTLQFLTESLEKAAGKNGEESEVFRIEGYMRPFHFYFIFNYVKSKGYESEPSFQRWLSAVGKTFQAQNMKYDLWVDALPLKMPDGY